MFILYFSNFADNFYNSVLQSLIHQLCTAIRITPQHFSLLDWTVPNLHAFLYFQVFSNSGCNFSQLWTKSAIFQICTLLYTNPDNFSLISLMVWSQQSDFSWKNQRLGRVGKIIGRVEKMASTWFFGCIQPVFAKIETIYLSLKIS